MGHLRSATRKGWVLDEINLPDETWRCEWPRRDLSHCLAL